MIANVNEKGRQTKLLAAIAVLAMVVCALAVVMPSEETGATIQSDVVAQELPTTSSNVVNNGGYYLSATLCSRIRRLRSLSP